MNAPRWMLAAIGFVLLFAIVLAPWIAAAPHSYPLGGRFNIADQGIATWLVSYVPHILTTAPSQFYDAPVFYPAPRQLARMEHLATTGVLFGPIYLLTGNAVLATNVAVLCSYPLAAFFLWALLVRLGVSSAAAAAGGIAFALGFIRAPGSLYLAKLPNWVLPMVALLITWVRERPTWRRALALAGGLAVAALTSYYMAVMTAIAAAVWAIAELASPRERVRAALLLIAGATLGIAVVAVVSLPYLQQPEVGTRVQGYLETGVPKGDVPALPYLALFFLGTAGPLLSELKWLGVLALLSRSPAGRASRRGLAIALVARSFLYGSTAVVFGHEVTTPYALLTGPTAGFFRYAFLFCVLLGFGESLLIAGGLGFIGGFLPGRARAIPAIVAAIAILFQRVPLLSHYGFVPSEGETHPVYDAVARWTRRNRAGPLLQLPLSIRGNMPLWESEMIGSTRHWLPLVGGVSGYPPAHAQALNRLIARLPDPRALDDLVSMTGVRWLLLRPEADWIKVKQRERIMGMRGLKRVAHVEGWDLLVVKQRGKHRRWRQQIASGPTPRHTVFGYPADIDLSVTRAKIQPPAKTVYESAPSLFTGLLLDVSNAGTTPWPVFVWEEDAPSVGLRFTASSRGQPDVKLPAVALLPRDVLPGETVRLRGTFLAPSEPGRYTITIEVVLWNKDGSAVPITGGRTRVTLEVAPKSEPFPEDGLMVRSFDGDQPASSASEPEVAVLAARDTPRERESLPALADVATRPRRIAQHEHVGWHVDGHDRARADHGEAADAEAAQNRGVGAEARAPFDGRVLDPVATRVARGDAREARRARHEVVGEDDAGADEDVVLDDDAVPEHHAVLDGDVVADGDAGFDVAVIADVAVAADARPREHVREGPDAAAAPDRGRLDDRVGVHEHAALHRGS